MYRIMAFFASGLVSFLLVGTVVAQQLSSASMETKPIVGGRLNTTVVRQISGTVKEIDLTAQTFSIKNRRGEQSFSITPETLLKRGRTNLKLAALQPESKVTVTYLDREGKKQASIIKLKK